MSAKGSRSSGAWAGFGVARRRLSFGSRYLESIFASTSVAIGHNSCGSQRRFYDENRDAERISTTPDIYAFFQRVAPVAYLWRHWDAQYEPFPCHPARSMAARRAPPPETNRTFSRGAGRASLTDATRDWPAHIRRNMLAKKGLSGWTQISFGSRRLLGRICLALSFD